MNLLNWVGKFFNDSEKDYSCLSFDELAVEAMNRVEEFVLSGKKVEFREVESVNFFGGIYHEIIIPRFLINNEIVIGKIPHPISKVSTEKEDYLCGFKINGRKEFLPISIETYNQLIIGFNFLKRMRDKIELNEIKNEVARKVSKWN